MAIGKSGSVLVMVEMMWFLLVRMHRSASLPRGNEFWLEILVVEHGGEHGRDLDVHTGDGVDLHVTIPLKLRSNSALGGTLVAKTRDSFA